MAVPSSGSNSNIKSGFKPNATSSSSPAVAVSKDPRLVALGGHAVFVVLAVASLLFSAVSSYAYGLACVALMVANGAMIVNELQGHASGWFERVLGSVHYPNMVLSLLLWSNREKPLWILSLPLILESLFTGLSMASTMPMITALPIWRQALKGKWDQMQAIKPLAMLMSAHLMIVAFPWLLISGLTNSTALISLFVYAQIVFSWLPRTSTSLRQALADWQRIFTALIAHPACPAPLKLLHTRLQSTATAPVSGSTSPLSTSATSLPSK